MTVSTPVKIVALAGLAIALGLGGLLLLTSKHASANPPLPVPVTHHSVAPAHHVAVAPKAKPKPHKAAIKLLPGLPSSLRQALLRDPVAVVVVYSSTTALDHSVFIAARDGAHAAHAGFVAANVSREPIARAIARWSSAVMDPAVLVVHRPGNITFTVSGTTDRDTVAQAAAAAR